MSPLLNTAVALHMNRSENGRDEIVRPAQQSGTGE
jgi:hypothetical protein